MRKKFCLSRAQRKFGLLCWGVLCLTLGLTNCAYANADLDRQYSLETIGYLQSWDNLDGLFADYVSDAFKEYFSTPSQFVVHDLSQANAVFASSKMPYKKVIMDPEILGQLAMSTRTETLIRTRVTKEGAEYFFTLDWLHAPFMEVLASVRFGVKEPTEGASFANDLVSVPLRQNLDRLFSEVPFKGHVTGRDDSSIVVNYSGREKLKVGDTLVVGTIDEVRKHPLLKTIAEWRVSPTGKLTVEAVQDRMVFCRIRDEEPGREVSRFQKIVEVFSSAPKEAPARPVEQIAPAEDLIPQTGWISVSLPVGAYSRQFTSPAAATTYSGDSFLLGGKVDAQLWLTRSWFFDFGFGYSFWNFTQKNSSNVPTTLSSTVGGADASMLSWRFDLGYSVSLNNSPSSPKGWLKGGYKSDSYEFPTATREFIGPIAFGSVFMGIGGDFPVLEKFGVQANFNYRLFTTVTQTWLSRETANSASDIELQIRGYYKVSPALSVAGSFEVGATNASFSAGSNLSQKTITFGPLLLYYF